MNARRDSSDELSHGSFGGRLLLTAAILFALAATGVLILSDDLKWMRLGIVAGLWAALVGAFVAARYRRQVADREEEAVERQERYELELEREIAARREYELEVQAEARRQAEEEARDHMAALRAELHNLRHTLQTLLGGEVLVERYALRAESTRMRSLSGGHPLARDNELKRLPPARAGDEEIIPAEVCDAHTDLIERVQEAQRPKRTVAPLPGHADRPARPEFAQPEPVQVRMDHNPHPAELSDRWFVPDGLGEQAEPAAVEPDWTPSWEATAHAGHDSRSEQADAQPYGARQYVQQTQFAQRQPSKQQDYGWVNDVRQAAATGRAEASGYTDPRADATAQTAIRPVAAAGYPDPRVATGRAEASGYTNPRAEASGYTDPGAAAPANGRAGRTAEASGYVAPVGRRAAESGYLQPVQRSGRAAESGYLQPVRASRHAEPTGAEPTHHRAAEDEPGHGGGRRRRPASQPNRQDGTAQLGAGQSGSHARPEPAPETSGGSHTSGRSVNELLASHGGAATSTPRRRRRREE